MTAFRSLYECLYLALFKWSERVNGKEYFNNHSASLLITLILFVNLGTLASLMDIATAWAIPNSLGSKVSVVMAMVLVSAFNYWYFTRDHRYLTLLYQYRETLENRVGLIVGLTVGGSLTLLFVIWFIGLQLAIA